MQHYYIVTYRETGNIFSSNLVQAKNEADVQAHYSQYDAVGIREITLAEVDSAAERGMPFVKVSPQPVEEPPAEPIYINENWPTSNKQQGVSYHLIFDNEKRRYETVDDLQTAVSQCRRADREILYAARVELSEQGAIVQEFHPETREEQRDRENRDYCKRIAEECEAYVSGDIRRCPECGEEIHRDWDEADDPFECPDCGTISDPDEWEQLSVWDYLSDVLDVEFRVGGKHDEQPRSVRLMVACGGPNIYLDTASRDVELYWWNETARYPLSNAAVDALDEWAAEYWGCM